jgi:hypothetical protein
LLRLMRPVLLAAVALAVVGCQAEPRDDEIRARDESTFITRPSGVGDAWAVYHVDSSGRATSESHQTRPRP